MAQNRRGASLSVNDMPRACSPLDGMVIADVRAEGGLRHGDDRDPRRAEAGERKRI